VSFRIASKSVWVPKSVFPKFFHLSIKIKIIKCQKYYLLGKFNTKKTKKKMLFLFADNVNKTCSLSSMSGLGFGNHWPSGFPLMW
jgi:hypothetical protein